jgi:hypothetical protein
MATRILAAFTAALILGFASVAALAAEPTSPIIVARINRRNITKSIPTTTVFTPQDTGVFRVSSYLTITTPIAGEYIWILSLNWGDDAGLETTNLAYGFSTQTPPDAYFGNIMANENQAPFTFEAKAGQPVSLTLEGPPQYAGSVCALAIIIERLE